MPDRPVASVLEAIAARGSDGATDLADEVAAAHPDDPLAAALAAHLRRLHGAGVYDAPTGFQEFIDNGSNPALYEATIAAVRGVHRRADPSSVVDVGAGDGRVTQAVVDDGVDTLHLVDPSNELLERAAARPGWTVPPSLHPTTLEEFVASLSAHDRFDLVQSTFALHATNPAGRPAVLGTLRGHCDVVVMVDFDVPAFTDRGPEHARYAADRYRRAMDEYRDHPAAVEGFLMPVLVGQFDPDAARLTYEQPARDWAQVFADAGFAVTVGTVFEYWWAPAFILEARSG